MQKLPDFLRVDSSTGTIQVAPVDDYGRGIFKILITGTLPNLQQTSTEISLVVRVPKTANQTQKVKIEISKMTLNGTFKFSFS